MSQNNYKLLKPFYNRACTLRNNQVNKMKTTSMGFAPYQLNARNVSTVVLQKPLLVVPTLLANPSVAGGEGYSYRVVRAYGKNLPSSDSVSSNLPSKEQLERYFFRTLAFIYDFTLIVVQWSWRMFQRYILDNPKAQAYWKFVYDKMQQSKRH